jgi:hypothetical protein
MPPGDEMLSGLYPRELIRQAVLIAAREELRLLTRDVLLGEDAPPDASARVVRLNLRLTPRREQFDMALVAQSASDDPYQQRRLLRGAESWVASRWSDESQEVQSIWRNGPPRTR